MGWNDGILYLVALLVRRLSIGRFAFRKYYFVSQPLPIPRLLHGRGQNITIAEVDESHPAVRDFPRPGPVIEWRFRVGARCFLASSKDSRFLGFLWIKQGSYDEDEVRCRFTPVPSGRTAWDFDVFVDPSQRNGLAFLRLWEEAGRALAGEGVEWSVSRIAAFNPGSIDSHIRLGAFPVGCAHFLTGSRWQLLFLGASPYVHLSLGPARIPEIPVNGTIKDRKDYRRFRRRMSTHNAPSP